MPKISTVVADLLDIELKLLTPFTNSKNHHLMECLICGELPTPKGVGFSTMVVAQATTIFCC